jgi:pimeloyl-ACP methyl ester carboxylesterase
LAVFARCGVDISALIAAAGGSASVFGHSSGATLALKAAASGLPITHLVLYEPPFNTDDSYPTLPADFAGELADWCPRAAAAIAHIPAYDAAIIGDRFLAGRTARHRNHPGLGDHWRAKPRSCAAPRRQPRTRCQTAGWQFSPAIVTTSIPTPPRRS